jgi:hypothetical protein
MLGWTPTSSLVACRQSSVCKAIKTVSRISMYLMLTVSDDWSFTVPAFWERFPSAWSPLLRDALHEWCGGREASVSGDPLVPTSLARELQRPKGAAGAPPRVSLGPMAYDSVSREPRAWDPRSGRTRLVQSILSSLDATPGQKVAFGHCRISGTANFRYLRAVGPFALRSRAQVI